MALCAVLCALGVTLLWLGSVLDFLDLTVACAASLVSVFAVIELRGKAPYMIYAVTGVLSLILVPVKFTAVEYIAFAGIYPIIKYHIERRLRRAWTSWLFKMIYCALMLALLFFAARLMLTGEAYTPALLAVTAVLGVFAFILYDIVLTRFISIYFYKLRDRLRVERFLR